MIVYPILPPGLFWNSSFFGAFVVLELFILVLYAYWLPTMSLEQGPGKALFKQMYSIR